MNGSQFARWLQESKEFEGQARAEYVEWNLAPTSKYEFVVHKLQGEFQCSGAGGGCAIPTSDQTSEIWCAGPWEVFHIQYYHPGKVAPCAWRFRGTDALGQTVQLCTQPGGAFRIWCELVPHESTATISEVGEKVSPVPPRATVRTTVAPKVVKTITSPVFVPAMQRNRAYLSREEYDAFEHAYDSD